MKKIITGLGILITLSACGNKPVFMELEVIFRKELGSGITEVGSNKEMLEDLITDTEQFMIGDYLDVPFSAQIFRNKVYVADQYNEKIGIYPVMGTANSNITVIPDTGDGYAYQTPFQVALNKYGEIYSVAAQTNDNTNDMYSVYFVYKFSIEGNFLYRIGEEGVNSGPMAYPARIDTDLFDNLYVYHWDFADEKEKWIVERYSSSGEKNFEFDTRYISLTNRSAGNVYLGRISDVYNFKNDERLLLYTSYRIIERDGEEVTTPDEYFNSLDIYSILQNAITENVFTDTEYVESILGITQDDQIVLFGYDSDLEAIRFRFINLSGSEEDMTTVYYVPKLSSYYVHVGFFLDAKGELYSIIVQDNKYFNIVHWIKPQDISV